MIDSDELQRIKQRFGIIGNTSQLNRAIEVAVQVAPTDLSVLITGESGVGKEHFPQIIHQYSNCKHGPYFAINCGAIPEGTIDSELFGHEKGAFTDARSDRKGYFEIADGGTLFLDEVGELPLSTQVRLLRVLETGEFIKVGSSKAQKTKVRVVAATNLNMKEAIMDGKFREDLYYRLNSIEIHLPPLRERKEDIPLLFRKFAVDFAERTHMPPIRLNNEATALLQNYYWYGNIRQLKNVAEQISVIESQREINADTLRTYLPDNEAGRTPAVIHRPADREQIMNEREMFYYRMLYELKNEMKELKEQIAALSQNELQTKVTEPTMTIPVRDNTASSPVINTNPTIKKEEYQTAEEVKQEPTVSMQQMEREAIIQSLERHAGNRRDAAAELGISERTLYRKIKSYGL